MKILAYCGFECKYCPVYIATATYNEEMKEGLILQYATNMQPYSISDMSCLGCHSSTFSEKLCGGCQMRRCAIERNLTHCGYCADYPCGYLTEHIPGDSASRKNLDDSRKRS